LKDWERAYKNFFVKRTDFSRASKKKSQRDSFRYPDPKRIKLEQGNNRLFLPKLGWCIKFLDSGLRRNDEAGIANVFGKPRGIEAAESRMQTA
jgi:hypothetical protein